MLGNNAPAVCSWMVGFSETTDQGRSRCAPIVPPLFWGTLQGKPATKSLNSGLKWWAHKGSNLGPLPCEGNALPLSYAPGTIMPTAGLSAGRHIGARDLEVRAKGVKFPGASRPENLPSITQSQAKPWFGPLMRPAGGRGRRGPGARGCARRAFRRLRAG